MKILIRGMCLIFISNLLIGCSESDSSTGSGGNAGAASTVNNNVTVYSTDLYAPDEAVSNACSSPLWESVAGSYNGTIAVEEAGTSAGGFAPVCNWDVELILTRVYEPNTNRSVCNLKTDFYSSLVTNSIISSSGEASCVEMNVSGVIKTGFEEYELSNPNWPVALRLNIEPVLINSERRLYPIGESLSRLESIIFGVDGFGNMSHIYDFEVGAPSFFHQYNVQRIAADIAQLPPE